MATLCCLFLSSDHANRFSNGVLNEMDFSGPTCNMCYSSSTLSLFQQMVHSYDGIARICQWLINMHNFIDMHDLYQGDSW